MKFTLLFFLAGLFHRQAAYAQPIGHWALSTTGLPVYHYTGVLPFRAADKNGKDADLPEDPYFLLGNYRMALLTHASGRYQFLTAERAWARLNAAEQTNYGWNDAGIVFKNDKAVGKINLVGLNSLAANPAVVQKSFGVGVARYTYQAPKQIRCTRTISVKPSPTINAGNPAFAITVTLANSGTATQELAYTERMRVNFVLNGALSTPKKPNARYPIAPQSALMRSSNWPLPM